MNKNKFKIGDCVFLIYKNQIVYTHITAIQSFTTEDNESDYAYKYCIERSRKKRFYEYRLFKSLKNLLQFYVDYIEEEHDIEEKQRNLTIKTYF